MSVKKRGLGKGLSALIQDKEKVETLVSDIKEANETIEAINIEHILPKKDQPRKIFDEGALKDLTESIKSNGVIQPIIVRKIDEQGYEIIAGERRWRAAKKANLNTIPAIIRNIDEETASKISLIENVQRENLNPIEEAQAYKRLMNEYNLKQDELAKAVGKSRSYISNYVRLLKLDERVVELLYEGKLSSGHGKALLGIKDLEEQYKAAERIIFQGSNVRDTESDVKMRKKKVKKKKWKESYVIEVEDRLMSSLGTKVRLNPGKKTGKIEIEYYGNDDLERLIDLLTK